MPHLSFKIKAESISTFGTNGLMVLQTVVEVVNVKKSQKTS